ncbi:uncharacterized protein LOC134194359 [Corticium candelabrum]|uniref:uncharacterized protein LOC134194359 n=1 Tax=Corticium candelabrum TaxID=121492 RepID=UPI002E2697A1|nr:uncharacterized protein LOC134194359 [Corticium candelabrum]
MSKGVLYTVFNLYAHFFRREDTGFRKAVPQEKRMAIVLYWVAHAPSFSTLAALFGTGKATAVSIVHTGVQALRRYIVPSSIRFPTGNELSPVVCDVEASRHLPQCAGALDGTFMRIEKPVYYEDAYYCYKRFQAIIILGCVDAQGIFTFVNSGRPGSVGVSFSFNRSSLKRHIDLEESLSPAFSKAINGQDIRPFLVADAAFSLSPTALKCYNGPNLTAQQSCFNYSVIRTRRVVEQAFGRLKRRWKICSSNRVKDPIFAGIVGSVCCGLHNICERYSCPFENDIFPDPHVFQQDQDDNDADLLQAGRQIRDVVVDWIYVHFSG